MNSLRLYMSQMESLLVELSIQLQRFADADGTHYFDMPRITLEQEEDILENGYKHISVTPYAGAQAAEKCKEAFSDWYVFDEKLSRRYLHKHPGVVVVSNYKGFLGIQELVTTLNELKSLFKAEVQKQGNDWEKWDMVHTKFNYIITMAVYRGIHCFDECFDGMYFNWVTRKRSQKYTRQDLLDKLERSRAHIPEGRHPQQWNTQVNDEIDAIKSTQFQQFSSRRTINYRPECNLRKDGNMSTISAGLPIIVPSPPSKLTMLKSLDTSARSKKSSSPDAWQLLIPRMHLYADTKSISW